MSSATVVVKVPDDIEYRLLGNIFGLLILLGGLLAGKMVSEHSFNYWREDVAVILLLIVIGFRLTRNGFTYFNYCLTTDLADSVPSRASKVTKEKVEQEFESVAQLPDVSEPYSPNMDLSPEKVVEQVVKRIEAQKAESARLKKIE